MPKIAADTAHSVVITGLRMKGSERFIAADLREAPWSLARKSPKSSGMRDKADERARTSN